MAELVKLENGRYINIDTIIIDEGFDEEHYIANTLGFDNCWEAHTERLTEIDLNRIIKGDRKHD